MANLIGRRIFFNKCPKNFTLIRGFQNFKPSSNVHIELAALNRFYSYQQTVQNGLVFNRFTTNCIYTNTIRWYGKDTEKHVKDDDDETKKLSLYQKFKKMYKEYWYVLIPVHLATSAVWFGGFYYLVASGVDVASILESLHIPDVIVNPLRDSKMGYLAVTFAVYKISAPARYAVTLGGTTLSINYLKKWGYIKPVPSKERLKEIYKEKKDDFLDGMNEKKNDFLDTVKEKTGNIKEKQKDLVDNLGKSVTNIKHTTFVDAKKDSLKNKKKQK